MTEFLRYAVVIIVGYFLGNISTGQWIGYWFGGTDIRQHGSGNQGTTNVLRTLGYLPSVLTLLGDALKGVLAALLGLWLLGPIGARVGGLAATIGRLFPALYRFKGGKGIATALGVLIVTDPLVILCIVIFQFVVIALTKYMSFASLLSAVAYFVAMLIRYFDEPVVYILAAVLSALLIFAHRENIGRLFTGKENKLNFKKIHLRQKPK